jgi:hypothetical protein
LLAATVAFKGIPDFGCLRKIAWWNWTNPIPAVVSERFFYLVQLTVDGEFAERRFA